MITSFILGAVVSASGPGTKDVAKLIDDFSGQAEGYAVAARLPVLREGQSVSEIRVWQFSKQSKTVKGWVLTPREVRIYSGREKIIPIAITHPKNALKLFQMFIQISSVEGSVCPAMNGIRLVVEGLDHGHYFVAYVGNPSSCKTSLSQEVARAYIALTNLRP